MRYNFKEIISYLHSTIYSRQLRSKIIIVKVFFYNCKYYVMPGANPFLKHIMKKEDLENLILRRRQEK